VAKDAIQPGGDRSQRGRTDLYDVLKLIIPVLWIAATWLPLTASEPIAHDLSGKSTNVGLTLSITISVTIVVSAALVALLLKTRGQREELRRLRRRITDLELELASTKELDTH
jgi:hypothetical protein